jgi:hypothetical protein
MTILQTRKVATMAAVSRSAAGTHRWLDWIGHLARRRATIYIMTIVVGVYGVLQRCSGLGRSLWLDEAWVANSVSAPSLEGMFYYDAWLQSSPPLFLLLVRLTVAPFGPSNTSFRAVPFFMGILAILSMLLFAARTLSRQYALLAWTLLVLSPFAIDYSKELKQYSSELAVSATILLLTSLYVENGRGHPNEPQIMRTILRERGCVEMPTPAFTNIGVDSFDCSEQAAMSFVR